MICLFKISHVSNVYFLFAYLNRRPVFYKISHQFYQITIIKFYILDRKVAVVTGIANLFETCFQQNGLFNITPISNQYQQFTNYDLNEFVTH